LSSVKINNKSKIQVCKLAVKKTNSPDVLIYVYFGIRCYISGFDHNTVLHIITTYTEIPFFLHRYQKVNINQNARST